MARRVVKVVALNIHTQGHSEVGVSRRSVGVQREGRHRAGAFAAWVCHFCQVGSQAQHRRRGCLLSDGALQGDAARAAAEADGEVDLHRVGERQGEGFRLFVVHLVRGDAHRDDEAGNAWVKGQAARHGLVVGAHHGCVLRLRSHRIIHRHGEDARLVQHHGELQALAFLCNQLGGGLPADGHLWQVVVGDGDARLGRVKGDGGGHINSDAHGYRHAALVTLKGLLNRDQASAGGGQVAQLHGEGLVLFIAVILEQTHSDRGRGRPLPWRFRRGEGQSARCLLKVKALLSRAVHGSIIHHHGHWQVAAELHLELNGATLLGGGVEEGVLHYRSGRSDKLHGAGEGRLGIHYGDGNFCAGAQAVEARLPHQGREQRQGIAARMPSPAVILGADNHLVRFGSVNAESEEARVSASWIA